jgi:hypothetical protein
MLKNSEVIQRVLSLYNQGVHTNQNRFTKKFIYNKLITIRGILLSQQANKKYRLPIESYQVLECIEMEKAPLSECNCLHSDLLPFITVYRSKKQVPDIIKSNLNYLINDISTVGGSIRLSLSTYSSLNYHKGKKYGKLKPFVFLYNNHLWMINADYTLLEIRAIFSNPTEVYTFNYCGCNQPDDCESYNEKDFPFPVSTIDTLIAMTIQELVGNKSQPEPKQQQE